MSPLWVEKNLKIAPRLWRDELSDMLPVIRQNIIWWSVGKQQTFGVLYND